MYNGLFLYGNEIHDIDMLIDNITDKDGVLKAFRNGSLYTFLHSCFYTDEAEAIASFSDLKCDSLYKNIVDVLTGNAPKQVIVYGRSDLKKPEEKRPDHRVWRSYLKEKSRAFRKNNNTIYHKRSSGLLKRLQIDDEQYYLIHDNSLFSTGKYGFAVLSDGIAYVEMLGLRKRKFLSYKEIRKHGGLFNDDGIPTLRWHDEWNTEVKGKKIRFPIPSTFVDDFLNYVNDLADKHNDFDTTVDLFY